MKTRKQKDRPWKITKDFEKAINPLFALLAKSKQKVLVVLLKDCDTQMLTNCKTHLETAHCVYHAYESVVHAIDKNIPVQTVPSGREIDNLPFYCEKGGEA